MASRKIEDLLPELQEKAKLFAVRMAEAGIPFMFTCTYRSPDEQLQLFRQGRSTPGPIVTWTTHSQHCLRRAFDFAILKDGKPCWDLKADVNDDDVGDYAQAGKIAEELGLQWGVVVNGKRTDLAHVQLQGNE
jgi:peptidoglycan L-alanyl-D-glutamate endopeptidase CwlK